MYSTIPHVFLIIMWKRTFKQIYSQNPQRHACANYVHITNLYVCGWRRRQRRDVDWKAAPHKLQPDTSISATEILWAAFGRSRVAKHAESGWRLCGWWMQMRDWTRDRPWRIDAHLPLYTCIAAARCVIASRNAHCERQLHTVLVQTALFCKHWPKVGQRERKTEASKRGGRAGGWMDRSVGWAHSHLVLHPAKTSSDRRQSCFIISGGSVRLLINGITARASPLIIREFWMPTARERDCAGCVDLLMWPCAVCSHWLISRPMAVIIAIMQSSYKSYTHRLLVHKGV